MKRIIKNDDGDVITRVNVMRLFTYDVEQIVNDLLEDNRAKEGDVEITFDDVMERVRDLADGDFHRNYGDLIFQDQDGTDI